LAIETAREEKWGADYTTPSGVHGIEIMQRPAATVMSRVFWLRSHQRAVVAVVFAVAVTLDSAPLEVAERSAARRGWAAMEGRTSAVTTGRRVGAIPSTARSEGTGVAGDGPGA
jgi:hypothetical protein